MDQSVPYRNEGSIAVPGGNVWYGIVGAGEKPPLLAVHGGPGAPHDYLLPFLTELAAAGGRPVIFYDQLGCGRSERPVDRSLWTVERYRDELACVVRSLRLEKFHLWGHSWGTQLALNYAATKPSGLLSLSLASPIIDIPSYRLDLAELLKEHPREIQNGIRNHNPGSAAYRAAIAKFYSAHLHSLKPLPQSWLKSFSPELFGADSYSEMVGTDEMNYTGNLKDRDDSSLLRHVEAPIWFHCGRSDIATPRRCRAYHEAVTGSRFEIFERSSHCYFDEERPSYIRAMREFLERHDG